MSTPVHEPSRQSAPPGAPQAEAPAEFPELGRISDTEGAILGAKYDTAVGWHCY